MILISATERTAEMISRCMLALRRLLPLAFTGYIYIYTYV